MRMLRSIPAIASLAAVSASGCGASRTPIPFEPRIEHLFSDVVVYDDVGQAGLDVVLLAQPRKDRLLGVYGDALYFNRDGRLSSLSLPGGVKQDLGPEAPHDAVGAGARGVYYVTPECAVVESSSDSPRIVSRIEPCTESTHLLAADATRLFVSLEQHHQPSTLPAKTTVWSVPRAGGPARPIADLAEGVLSALQDDTSLYLASAAEDARIPGGVALHILRLPKAGGPPVVIAETPPDRFPPELELVDGEFVYWKLPSSSFSGPRADEELLRTSTRTGQSTVLVNPSSANLGERLGSLTADATHFYIATQSSVYQGPRSGGNWRQVAVLPPGQWTLHVISGQLYAFDAHDRRMLLRIDLGRRARSVLDLPDVPIGSIAVNGPSLYYVASDASGASGDSIWVMPKTGGTPTRVLAARENIVSAPAFDADSAYFLGLDGRLLRAPLHGGPEQMLASPPTAPGEARASLEMPLPRLVEVDATSVYWLDDAHGAVLKVPKRGGPVEVLAHGVRLRDTRPAAPDPQMALDSTYVYFTRVEGDVTQVVRITKMGGRIERLIDGIQPRVDTTGAGVFYQAGDEVYGPSDNGFRSLGSLGGLRGRGAIDDQVCGFTGAAEAIFYSLCSDSGGDPPMVLRKSLADGALRILAIGYGLRTPIELVADADTLYFVQSGTHNPKGGDPRRPGCCTIWAVPR